MYVYINIHIHVDIGVRPCAHRSRPKDPPPLGLYNILFYFEASVHESTILSFPAPTCIAHPGAVLLHDYWAV